MKVQELILRRGHDERRAVFCAVNDSALQPFAAAPETLLSSAETARLDAMQFAQKRRGFLLGRLAAKTALGAMLAETDWRNIDIRPGVFGQPLVGHPRALGVDVTVSHSHGTAVALAYPADWPLGIDLETVADDAAAAVLAELDPSPDETAWLASGALGKSAACGVLWAAREALGKAMKTGVNCPLGILSLCAIQAADPPSGASTGTVAWCGAYTNFPQSGWHAQVCGGRVLLLAVPGEIEIALWPHL